MPQAIIRALDLDPDAECLATMWNESDMARPNCRASGHPTTAEMVRK